MGQEFYSGDVVETLADLIVDPDFHRGLPPALIPKGACGTVLSTFSHPLLIEVEFVDKYGRPAAVGHYRPEHVQIIRRAPLHGPGYFPKRRTPSEYLMLLAGALIILFLGAMVYQNYWSPAAKAEKTAFALGQAAIQGDAARVQSLLAPDADLHLDRVIRMYDGLTALTESEVRRAPSAGNGAEFNVRTLGLSPNGWRVIQMDLRRGPAGGWLAVTVAIHSQGNQR